MKSKMYTKITLLLFITLAINFEALGQEKLVWSSFINGNIYLSDLDGSNVELLIESDINSNSPGIEIDEINKLIFWTSGKAIYRSSYGGSNPSTGEEIYSNPDKIITDLALDIEGEKLFWSEIREDEIVMADYNGNNQQVIYTDLAINPQAVEYWPSRNELVYGRQGGTIGIINLSNLNREEIFEADFIISDLELDFDNDEIYFVNQNTIAAESSIEKIDTEGNNHLVLANNLGNPFGLAISKQENKVYWSDWSSNFVDLSSVNLDGSELSEVANLNDYRPYALEIIQDFPSNTVDPYYFTNPTIFPNPSNGNIQIQNIDNFDLILVYDQLGQTIKSINGTERSINLAKLNSGIYTLHFFEKGKQIGLSKILVH